jgi:hypothetical protein
MKNLDLFWRALAERSGIRWSAPPKPLTVTTPPQAGR